MNLPLLLFRLVLGRRLPRLDGTLRLPGLDGDLTIRRDGWGVAHVSASTDADGWFGLGFCHGQDRSFQLEMLTRVVRGTLAEAVGPEALPADRLSRRIGFYASAEAQMAALDTDVRVICEAYARGVNAGRAAGSRRRPHEFALLRLTPTPYTGADVLGVLKLVAFIADSNWATELARLAILTADGAGALAALDPSYPEWQVVTAPPGRVAGPAVHSFAAEAAALLGAANVGGGGSNSWVLARSRTRTGRPVAANDPHLSPVLPPHWYLAHVSTPRWSIAGGSFVGTPVFGFGHNGVAAWGTTFGLADNTDLFLEEMGPDGRSVREGDTLVPCESRREVIGVRGRDDVVEDVLLTARGPVVGPALAGAPEAVSLRATWLDASPMRGGLVNHLIRSLEDFRREYAVWPGLSANLVYADAGGAIGWELAGAVPRRRASSGALPQRGREPESWQGYVPAEDLPRAENPDTGFIVTANNKPAADGSGPFLGVDWLDGYRASRIAGALSERRDWDVASTMRLQMDTYAPAWREMRDIVLAVDAADADARRALALLRDWDGDVSADSAAAAVFELFVADMSERLARAKAPASYRWALGEGFSPLAPHSGLAGRRVGHLVRVLRDASGAWWGRPLPDEIAASLATVVRALAASAGEDEKTWAWGSVRPVTLEHPFGARPLLRRVFNVGPLRVGGDANTIAQVSVAPMHPTASPTYIPSARMAIDVGAWENSRFVLPGGQSGNPCSPHYRDQVPLWERGDGIGIPWTEDAVQREARHTLRLVPQRGSAA